MNVHDFVYMSVYKTALKEPGVKERIAREFAQMALDDFKKNKFKKPDDVIKKGIKNAIQRSKKA